MSAGRWTHALTVLIVAIALHAAPAGAQRPLPEVPGFLAPWIRDSLARARAGLTARSSAYAAMADAHDSRCGVGKVLVSDVARQASCQASVDSLQRIATPLTRERRQFSARVTLLTAVNTDPSVVDARVPMDGAQYTAQVPELAASPEAGRITKGFQAVVAHDWPVALAWWQEALNRDPANEALKRSVDLAQWMVDRRQVRAAGPVTPLGAGIRAAGHGDHAEAMRQFELAKQLYPGSAADLDHLEAQVRASASVAAANSREIDRQQRLLVWELYDAATIELLELPGGTGPSMAQKWFNDAEWFALGLPSDEMPWGAHPKRPTP